jgi:hypothetical protein
MIPVTDIYIDEQTTLEVNVDTIYPDGSPRDITGGSVTWVASFNGIQQIKKDTDSETVLLAPQTSTYMTSQSLIGQSVLNVNQVSLFGSDPTGRPIANFAAGNIITIVGPTTSEYNVIRAIDFVHKQITTVSPLINTYPMSTTVAAIISQFSFTLLPGDTILPATKSYGTQMVWSHMAVIKFTSQVGPENVYAVPTTVVGVRGKMFINPILDMG